MKRTTKIKLLVYLILGIPAAAWLVSEYRWPRINNPKGKFTNVTEYLSSGRQPSRIGRIEKDGGTFFIAYGPMDTWLAVPSGPAAYVFDKDGRMIDWSWDTGDDPGFGRQWAHSEQDEITAGEFEKLTPHPSSHKPIASMTSEEKAKLARSLVERAIKTRDPQAATQMLIKASKITRQLLRNRDAIKYIDQISVSFDADDVDISHLEMRPTKSTLVDRVKDLSPRLKLIEKRRISEYAFIAMVDAGKGAVSPIPFEDDDLEEQTLKLDGKTIYSARLVGRNAQKEKIFHVSPDHNYILIEILGQKKTMDIMDIRNGKSRTIEEPAEIQDHAYVSPFSFVKWSDDSKTAVVQIEGGDYQEIWHIEARTGKISKVSRQTKKAK